MFGNIFNLLVVYRNNPDHFIVLLYTSIPALFVYTWECLIVEFDKPDIEEGQY